MKTKLLIGSFLLAAVALGFWHERNHGVIPVWQAPKLLSSMRAKEFCSCRFMLGYEESYCLKRVVKGFPVFDYSIDEANKRISFSNYLSSSSAVVRGPKLGCILE